ncbi:amino acid adenylation domain-containing protein [Streptomyces sp. NPDC021093]|uniref:amino acid adenylation domain-containing protein n=1 Tax=Streptomyces sp. NPDC021093 TaxID=3365112 RepID=UPI003795A1F5
MPQQEQFSGQRFDVAAPGRASAALAVAAVAARVCHTAEATVRIGDGLSPEESLTLTEGGRAAVARLAGAIDRRSPHGVIRLDVHCDSCRDGAVDHRPCRLELSPAQEGGRQTVAHDCGDTFNRWGPERTGTVRERLAASPEAGLEDLVVAGDTERRMLLALGGPRVTRPAAPLHELIVRTAERHLSEVAVVAQGESLTYAELLAQGRALADGLRAEGVARGDVVGVSAWRSLELPGVLLGILLAGGAYLPLGPEVPAARLAHMIGTARARIVVCAEGTEGKVRQAAPGARLLGLSGERLPGSAAEPVRRPAEDRPEDQPGFRPDDPAYVLFTSGSTGRPKGVVVPHEAIVNRLLWMQEHFRLDVSDVVLQKTPFDFDVSVWEFFWPLLAGARLAIAPPLAHLDPEEMAETVVREEVTVAHFVPCVLEQFLREPRAGECARLQRVICSGEVLPPALANRAASVLGVTVHNLYGPTEAAVDVTAWECRTPEPGPAVPIGPPIDNVGAHVLSPAGEPVPFGAVGELHLAGVCLASGYAGAPDLTRERFVPDPFTNGTGDRMYRTGDLVRWSSTARTAEGRPALDYRGRMDQQIKIHGIRIEAGEVEHVLDQHPGVTASAVVKIGTPDGDRLVGCLVVGPDGPPGRAELRRHALTHLPAAMVPAQFAVVERFPMTGSGKTDRSKLRELLGRDRSATATASPAPEVLR